MFPRPVLLAPPPAAWSALLGCWALFAGSSASAQPSTWDAPLPPPVLKISPRLQEHISPSVRPHLPLYVEADQLSGQVQSSATLEGNAQLRRGDTVIRADRAHYDAATDTVTAEGQVHINRAGNIYQGTRLQMQVDAFKGDFTQARYQFLDTQGHGQAERVEFHDRERSTIYHGNYTTCQRDESDPSDWQPDSQPDWELRAQRLELDHSTDTGVAHGAVLKFKNVPILPVPAISFPLSDRRKSGLLPPTMGIDSVSGLEYAQPYYWNIAPNYDATITPTLMSKRGVNLGTQFRYLQPSYQGTLDVNYMPDDRLRERERWSYAWQHEADLSTLTPSLRMDWQLHRVSDSDYWRDFSLRNNNHLLGERLLNSQGQLHWQSGGHRLLARAQQWQVLQDLDAPIAPPFNRLPQVQWRYSPTSLSNAWGLDWRLEADSTRFRARTVDGRQHVDNGQRSYALAEVSRPFLGAASFITPRLQLHAAHYQLESANPNHSSSQRSFSSVLPTFSVDSGLIFERPTQWRGRSLVQTLEPRAFYTYTPHRDQMRQPLYDTALSDFNLTSIYSENSYTGHDRIADNHMLTLGLSTRYLHADTGAELARFGIAQRLRFTDQRTSLGYDTPGEKGWSDLLLGAGLNLNHRWSLDALVQYNRDIQRTTRSAISGRYQPGDYRVISAAYRYQRENSAQIANQGSEQIDIGWQWPLQAWGSAPQPTPQKGRWYSVGRLNYSMHDKKLVDAVLGFEYDSCCWIGRVVVERLQNSVSRSNTRLLFQLEFVGFSRLSLGADPLSSLKNHVPGYQPLGLHQQQTPSRFSHYD